MQPDGFENLEGNAVVAEHGDVLRGALHLLLGAEELEGALRPLVIGDAGLGAERVEAVAAVFREPHHPRPC